jgi:transposase-like protein
MKKKRYSVQAIMRIVRASDSESVSGVSRKHGITEQTLYLAAGRWWWRWSTCAVQGIGGTAGRVLA